jgi:hypothetical protein
VLPTTGESPPEQVDEFYRRHAQYIARNERPILGPLVRFYDEGGPTLDLRSGLSSSGFPVPAEWKRLILAGLPLPAELEAP